MALKIIQVGLGGWGRNWNKSVIKGFPGIKPVGYVDNFKETLQLAIEKCDLPEQICFDRIDTALKKVDCDAVVITANLEGHVPVARAALLAGKHVLVENPFAPSVKEARALVDLAKRKKKILMVSQNYRFYPAMRWLQNAIKTNTYGRLCSVAIDFRQYKNKRPKKGTKHYYIDHPLLMDMAIHQFDLLRMVIGGDPAKVYCKGINPAWSNFRDPPAAFATMEFAKGVTVSYRGSWVAHGPTTSWSGDWWVELENAAFYLSSRGDGQPDQVTMYTNGDCKGKNIAIPRVLHKADIKGFHDRKGSLKDFITCIAKNKTPETSGHDNIGTLTFMDAMVKSAESGKMVTVR